MAWNLSRLAEALLPVSSLEAVQEILGDMEAVWHRVWADRVPDPSALGRADDITTYNREHHGGPVFVPRNHMLESAITAAERKGDLAQYRELLAAVTDPYNAEAGPAWMAEPEGDLPYVTFCGT